MSEQAILEIDSLHVNIGQADHAVHAVRGTSLAITEGMRLGLIGESGSGKTITALAVLRLLPPAARVTGGSIRFRGRDLSALNAEQMRRVRGKEIGIVFQNAQGALNPLFPVGRQIADVYRYHEGGGQREAWKKEVAMLDEMGIPEPESRARAYPHQYSGGMAQRAMVAMALVCSPQILIADEPTTGLDLTIQAQVLDLIKSHVIQSSASLILISHDLAVIADLCTDVAVMYAGEVMEAGKLDVVFGKPRNPYTRALVDCFTAGSGRRLPYIAGRVPDLHAEPPGCSFAQRCPMAQSLCQFARPALREVAPGQWTACHFA
jgi:oligopeptide/dipeptide ABC transporter ATP-binding protein